MLAVSKKLIPTSSALSMIVKLSASAVCWPKFMVPRHSRLTLRPVRPRWVYFTVLLLFALQAQLPPVEPLDPRLSGERRQGDPLAVGPGWVDAPGHRDALVGEDLDPRAVEEDPQAERLATFQGQWCTLGCHIKIMSEARSRAVDQQLAP